MKKAYKVTDTKIQAGGVLRCCLMTVAEEYAGEFVKPGFISNCKACGREFILNEPEGDKSPRWRGKDGDKV